MVDIAEDTKQCLHCGKPIIGRSDKKFCDKYCRNYYNNKFKSDANNYIRQVNNALRKNRRILEQYVNPDKKTGKTSRDKLLQEGFNFKYFTHSFTNRKGDTYNYCYDFGYLSLDEDWFLIVREQDKN